MQPSELYEAFGELLKITRWCLEELAREPSNLETLSNDARVPRFEPSSSDGTTTSSGPLATEELVPAVLEQARSAASRRSQHNDRYISVNSLCFLIFLKTKKREF